MYEGASCRLPLLPQWQWLWQRLWGWHCCSLPPLLLPLLPLPLLVVMMVMLLLLHTLLLPTILLLLVWLPLLLLLLLRPLLWLLLLHFLLLLLLLLPVTGLGNCLSLPLQRQVSNLQGSGEAPRPRLPAARLASRDQLCRWLPWPGPAAVTATTAAARHCSTWGSHPL